MTLRAWSLFLDSPVGAESHGLEPFSTAFPNQKQRVISEFKQPGHNSVSMWDAGTTGRGLACCVTVPVQKRIFFELMEIFYILMEMIVIWV